MQVIWILLLILSLNLGHPATTAAVSARGGDLEELQYRVSLGPWSEVARVHLRLSQVGPGRYRAEFSGAAQGMWSLLNRWLPERYEAEMVLEQGRLKPLVYREVFQSKGKRVHKEYRFDYSRGVLEVWRGVDNREPEKDWQVALQGPIYDPLSLFYNLRLGTFGPLKGGETLRVAIVPTPETREMVFHIGGKTSQGREVMLEVTGQGSESAVSGPYFIVANPQRVPLDAWLRIFAFGKLSGELLNPEGIRNSGLPALSIE